MVALYGSIDSTLPRGASWNGRRRARVMFATSAAAVVALVALVAVTWGKGGGKTSLESVYKEKYDEIRGRQGGAWMGCMKCRHESPHCSPSKRERQGLVPMRTNACPPHAGMVTVSVKRKGKIALEWIDKAWLNHTTNGTNGTNGTSQKEPGQEDAAPEAEEGMDQAEGEPTVMCVKPPPGSSQLNSWKSSDDCLSVMDWIKGMDYSVGGYEEPAPKQRRRRLLEADGEETDDGRSPFQKWFDAKVNTSYEAAYGWSGAESEEEEGKGEEHEVQADDLTGEVHEVTAYDLTHMEPEPEDCYGPPSFECSAVCFTSCLSSEPGSQPETLKSGARLQQLSLEDELPLDVDEDNGYAPAYMWYGQPVVVPGGNRDMFGINNVYESARRVK